MNLVIDKKIAENYPDLRIGVIVAKHINNKGKNNELEELKETKTQEFRQKFSLDSLQENPYIIAWQETYRNFGVNPKKKQPTAEALLIRLLKGSNLPTISKAVDLYLAVEIEFLLPIGGYDLDRIEGDIVLRYSDGGEAFIPLGSTQEESTAPKEIVYADSHRILTRRWNYRDCDYTKITENTTNFILLTEVPLPTIPTGHLLNSLNKIEEYTKKNCGGVIKIFIADIKKQLRWEL